MLPRISSGGAPREAAIIVMAETGNETLRADQHPTPAAGASGEFTPDEVNLLGAPAIAVVN
jgi:hypothetical protein